MSTLLMRLKDALDYWIAINTVNINFKYGFNRRLYKISINIEEQEIEENEFLFEEEEL